MRRLKTVGRVGAGRYVGAFVLGFACMAAPAAAQTVEEVGKQIAAATDKLKSFSAKAASTTEMKQEGFSMASKGEGTTEMLRKGDDLLTRMEMKQTTETSMGGQVSKQEMHVLSITDGTNTYTLMDMEGNKSAQKMKTQKQDKDPFAAWKDSADLRVLPDATIDGRAVWVIEATPKGEAAAAQGKSIISFDKETGQMIKMITNGPDGKPLSTTTFSDIKVNPGVAEDRFVFKAPEGVEVKDLSNQ